MKLTLSVFVTLAIGSSAKEDNDQSGSLRGLSGQCGVIHSSCSSSADCCGDLSCHDLGVPGLYTSFRCTDEPPEDNHCVWEYYTPCSSDTDCCGDLICQDFGFDIYYDFQCTDKDDPYFYSYDDDDDDYMTPYQDNSQCQTLKGDCSSDIDCCGDMICHDFSSAGVSSFQCTDQAPSSNSSNDDDHIGSSQQDTQQCAGLYDDCSGNIKCCGDMTCHDFGYPGFEAPLCTDDVPSNSFDDDTPFDDDDDQIVHQECQGLYGGCYSSVDCCEGMICHDFEYPGFVALLCIEAPEDRNLFD